ncbi:MAG: MBL fold metallo-hydrolase [bacterium]
MENFENFLNYKAGKFRNYTIWQQPSLIKSLGKVWEFIFANNNRTPDELLPVQKVDISKFNNSGNNQLNVTWLGHSSTMINIDGYKILTDPVYEKRISLFGPTRYNSEVPFDFELLPEIDVVIISHNHYDHLNKYSIELIKDKVKLFIVPLKVGKLLFDWGVEKDKIVELDWWDEYAVNDSLKITATPSQHFSGRGLFDRDETLWASFVIQAKHHNLFFSGDGGYSTTFKEIGNKYGPFDITLMECGAYNEAWHHIHMYPEETVQAHIDLKGKILQPIHWGTFNLALHAWYEPMVRVIKEANIEGVNVALPIIGETTEYGKYTPTEKWWEEYITEINDFDLADNN